MASKFDRLLEEIGNMTVLDLADFVKELENKFGVSAAMPMAVAGAAPVAGAAQASAVEEKSEYSVTLQEAGDKKIDVIKALRKVIPGLALTEAKDKTENTPVVIAQAIPKEEAQKMKEALEAAGAKVKLA
jgi:large subunit ribosomal protein L7/L12